MLKAVHCGRLVTLSREDPGVRRLLHVVAEPAPRWGFQRPWLRAVLLCFVLLSVLQSVFFGNQPPS